MVKKITIRLSDIISNVCTLYKREGETNVYLDNGWCVYSNESKISPDTICYIDDYPEYDDEDNEILSEYVQKNDMNLIYRDELIQDVVIACINQKNNVSIDEIVNALIYYDENDTFPVL